MFQMSEIGQVGRGATEVLRDGAQLGSDLLPQIKILLPIWISEPIKPRHLRRVSDSQILAVLAAFADCNDSAFIGKLIQPSDKPGPGMGELLHAVVVASQGAYTHRDVLLMPIQEAVEILEAASRIEAAARGESSGAAPGDGLDEEERESLKSLLTRTGFTVT